MKKIFVLFAFIAALGFTGCDLNGGNDDGTTPAGAATFTIKNESSYDLSSVKWSGVTFASPDSSDLLKGTASKKPVTEEAQGYIYFTRKDIGIELRTNSVYVLEDSPVTISNNTVVLEIGNENNSGTLSATGLLPQLEIMKGGLSVAKNDTVSAIESFANAPKQIEFTLKNTGSGALTLTGAAPVSVSGSAGIFSVTQPTGSTIAPVGSLPFTVIFTPPAIDTYTTTVTVKSNTPSGDFTFTITANGVEPKPAITVLNGTNEVLQNGTVDMGNIVVSGTVDIAVKNTGIALLTVDWDAITITGADAAAFSFDSVPGGSGTISVGNHTTFRIRYTPSTIGLQSAVISILNNDSSRYSAVFTIRGTGYFPAPSSITASADSADSVTVSWNAVTGADSYKVYRAASPDGTYTSIGTSATTSYGDTGLSAGTIYYYKVSAVSTYGESAQSSYASSKTKPEAPTGVSAASLSDSSIQITWNSVGGADTYNVYRAASSEGTYTSVGTSSTSSYTNTGLSSNTTYYYKVSAYNAGGESVLSSETSAATQIAVPSGLSATALSSSSIQVTWNSVGGASSYTVYRAASAAGTYTSVGSSTTTSYTNTGLSGGVTYYYTVSAAGVNGEGAQSMYAAATTPPNAPTGISATALSFSSIRISWTSVTGANSYNVYRASSATGTYTSVGTSSTASYTNTGLSGNITYYYKVSASNNAGTGEQSSYVSATTPAAPILAPPSDFGVIPVSSGIRIFWSAVTDASGYNVYRATSLNGTYTSIATNVTGTTYLNTVSGSTVYYYKVATVNSDGVAGSQSAYNYSPGPGALLAVPYNSNSNYYSTDSITANGEKYYILQASANSRITIRWADASDGGSDFSPVLRGDIVVSACHEDTGEIIFLNHDSGYSSYTTFWSDTGKVILYVVGKTAGTFAIRYDYY
ncbi:hypothetical protein FACS189450_07840 [Spirochaetia bacterium]|nr:hypothetical protein FACS189450_07840 [Spirochaetia bacterium]